MKLTHEQRVAASARGHVTVVMACPGSGKTTTLVERIRQLVTVDLVSPKAIAVMTFTTAAAHELRARVVNVVGQSAGGMFIGTLHAYCLTIARITNPELAVMDEKASNELLDECAQKARYRGTAKDLKHAVATMRDSSKEPESPGEIVAKMYLDQCTIDGVVDYDGLLALGYHGITSAKHTHLLVDEYQDSGSADDRIYTAHPARDKFFVGDPDQAIYGFRGGRVRNILNRSATPLHLGSNFRSTKGIIIASNNLIANNQLRSGKFMRGTKDGPSPLVVKTRNEQSQAEYVGRKLQQMAIDKIADETDTFAILARTNKALDPYRLMRTPEPRERTPDDWELAVSIIALSGNPYNDRAAMRVLKAMRMNPQTIWAKANGAKTSMEPLNSVPELRVPLYGLTPITDVLAGYGVKHSIDAVAKALERLQDGATAGDLILALNEPDEFDVQNSAVDVCTMHAAKGREWDHVFIVSAVQGITPSRRSMENEESMEEERRLFYVAMTRARKTLTILHPEEIIDPFSGGVEVCEPSQFISEAFD